MPQLHELLAAESTLEGQATTCIKDLLNTFEKKGNHFRSVRKTFTPISEGASPVTEEQLDIQTTVPKELEWIEGKLVPVLDIGHQIDVANTTAKADIILDDETVLLKDVPATSLLQLEKRLAVVASIIKAVPTLAPEKGFKPAPQEGVGIYAAREVNKDRTQMMKQALVLYQATDKHPAQTTIVDAHTKIGTIQEQEWSSLISVTTKAGLLDRIEELQRAVKTARARANKIDLNTKDNKIGKKLLDYAFAPIRSDVRS